ncbi:MAG TPA: phosphoribosylamine--glycine ligase [Firmicutes bacterium]|nr:phosphoribosylamine--glycine ligase [Bacillota bacterium]
MKVLVIGGGAREHALVWKLSQSPKVTKIFAAPGNGGIAQLAQCVPVPETDLDGLLTFALREKIDLTVVGPEVPLVAGVVDRFKANGLQIFGPDQKGARLEGSKKYAKEFMLKYQIPTAQYAAYDNLNEAYAGLEQFAFPLVIKADGLAAGKGVVICHRKEEAAAAIKSMIEDGKFGAAGKEIIIEEFLEGVEASLLCLVTADKIIPLESAGDYKRLLDHDQGPNTGGMGCVSPNKTLTPSLMAVIEREILKPSLKGIQAEMMDYKGILFIGLMITAQGPKVLEFNVRFGDPETEVLLPRLETDLVDLFLKTIQGTITREDLVWSQKTCLGVVLATAGYPESSGSGQAITGLDEVDAEIMLFHAGTKREDQLVTNGGRVLAVVALGDPLDQARTKVYSNIKKIHFDGMQYRTDIGR